MKKAIICFTGLIVALAALASCSFQDKGISILVPENAFGFVQINDPDTFIKNIDAFAGPMGIKDVIGNLEIRDLLNTGLKGASGLELAAFDLKKPLGLAVLPPVGNSSDFGFILYLPLLKPEENGPKIKALLEAVGDLKFSTANGYAIFAQTADTISFPPAKAMQIPASLIFSPGTITVYGDLKSVLNTYQKEWTELKTAALSEITSLESAELSTVDPGTQAMTKSMLEGIFQGVEQTQSMAIEIAADAAGLRIKDTLEFARDGSISKLLKSVGSGKDIGSQSKYLPLGYLMNGAYSGDPSAFKDLYLAWMKQFLGGLKLSDTESSAFIKLMEDSFKLSGKNAAFGFDLQVTPELMTMSKEDVIENIGDAFTINMLMAQDISDVGAYQKFIKENFSNGVIQKYLDAVTAASGFALKLSIEDQKDGDFAYQSLAFDLSVADSDKLSASSAETRAAATMLASLMQKFQVVMSLKGNKLYMAMGDSSLDSLKKVVAADKVEKPITDNTVWNAWLKTVPSDAQYIGNLSTSRILAMVKEFSNNDVALYIPDGSESGINSYVQIKETSITGALSWDIKELSSLSKDSIGMITGLFMNSASQGDYEYDESADEYSGDGEYFGDGEGEDLSGESEGGE